jgi:hypothetical protein
MQCQTSFILVLACIMMYELCVALFENMHLIRRSLIFVRIILNGYYLELASSLCRPLNQPPNPLLAYEAGQANADSYIKRPGWLATKRDQ